MECTKTTTRLQIINNASINITIDDKEMLSEEEMKYMDINTLSIKQSLKMMDKTKIHKISTTEKYYTFSEKSGDENYPMVINIPSFREAFDFLSLQDVNTFFHKYDNKYYSVITYINGAKFLEGKNTLIEILEETLDTILDEIYEYKIQLYY